MRPSSVYQMSHLSLNTKILDCLEMNLGNSAIILPRIARTLRPDPCLIWGHLRAVAVAEMRLVSPRPRIHPWWRSCVLSSQNSALTPPPESSFSTIKYHKLRHPSSPITRSQPLFLPYQPRRTTLCLTHHFWSSVLFFLSSMESRHAPLWTHTHNMQPTNKASLLIKWLI